MKITGLRQWLSLSAISLCCASAALADIVPISIANTGANLAVWNGQVDPNYVIVSSPLADTNAYVVPTGPGYPIPPWAPDTTTSAWIGPAVQDNVLTPIGTYDYQVHFNLISGSDPVTLSGNWLVDDTGTAIEVNGVTVVQGSLPVWNTSTPFDLSSATNFATGDNTVDFIVYNTGGPTGLNVQFTSATESTPEPGTFGLLLSASGLLILGLRKKAIRA